MSEYRMSALSPASRSVADTAPNTVPAGLFSSTWNSYCSLSNSGSLSLTSATVTTTTTVAASGLGDPLSDATKVSS